VTSGPSGRAVRHLVDGWLNGQSAFMTQTIAATNAARAATAECDAPGSARFDGPGPILLATEFGPVSWAAERVAIRLARDARVPLLIVHAIDLRRLRMPGGRFRQRIDQARSDREHDTNAILARVEAAGVRAQVLVWEGDPATCVLDAARAEGASRIVVGSHGRGRLGRALVGSVSASVADAADRPVHIVRGEGNREDVVTIGATG